MDKEKIKKIVTIFNQMATLERTKELVETSTVLCFTTMDRTAEDTVSIEFRQYLSGGESATNKILHDAREKMVDYLSGKIEQLSKEIDKIIEEND